MMSHITIMAEAPQQTNINVRVYQKEISRMLNADAENTKQLTQQAIKLVKEYCLLP